MLTVSSRLIEFVASFEGFAAQLYNDPANHATIGFGHLVHAGPINGSEPAHFQQGLTKTDALALLRDDLKNAEATVTRLVNVPLRQHHFDALVSFAFNVGKGNFNDSDLLTRLNQNEYDGVPGEMNRWIFGNGQRLEGLVRRREREGRLFSKGQYKDEAIFTNQEVINAFAKAESALGREAWSLLTKSGLDVFHLAADRRGPFSDAPLAEALQRLSADERRAVEAQLPDGRDLPPADGYQWLKEVPALWDMPLTPPPAMRVVLPTDTDRRGRRMVRLWNQYGWLLTGIADYYALDVEWMLALMAVAGNARAFARDGLMVIDFEPQLFGHLWGQRHPHEWVAHFDPEGLQWRPTTTEPWRTMHASQATEWEMFTVARGMHENSALVATRMGMPLLSGAVYAHLGYESPAAMFTAFYRSDRAQLLGWFDFIAGPYGRARRLHALHERNIATFAALHYGADRAAGYTTRLVEAATWWRTVVIE